MPHDIVLQHSATEADLRERREALAALRVRLVEREAEVAQVRGQLRAFEDRYFRQVGVLYAALDDLEARIAEREVALYDSDAARERAAAARERAGESHDAAFRADEGEAEDVFDPPQSLKALFREVARRIHPDLARDAAEQAHRTLLMARANQAYRRGDADLLQRSLDDSRDLDASALDGDGDAAELGRIVRGMRQAQRDLDALDAEQHTLLEGEIGQLYRDAEAAALEHRDLLLELASGLREQVADAEYRLAFVERQVFAHGR